MMRKSMLTAASCVLLVTAVPATAGTPACATKASDTADVEATIKNFFATIERGDIADARKMTTPGFHAFDVGKHFAGPELLDMIEGAQKQGRKIGFGIDKVEANVDCNFAWAHWLNPGNIDETPITWQESGVLRRAGKGWIIEFIHSERISSPAAK
ncbi:nuclear transport factor 2 family protein [Sphingosinicella rhizophila]|uniref:Nuclear transport factor 2 family protein n=1 Tax=Sphingosinicella rhizophila TaxID=3050082 RepID=A0ABU3QAX3_9SPHN|nr:nuclear transport factor 2 family protein [Sphingosinicella sp. GR2756]MDT9600561.1 nuclear transport factor 2 family protein [Sphingosinicella sp. GR2756]